MQMTVRSQYPVGKEAFALDSYKNAVRVAAHRGNSRYYPEMTVNVELRDYPKEGEDWAFVSCDKSLALIEQYGMADRIWINCWSGELLEYIDKKYNHRYRLHD